MYTYIYKNESALTFSPPLPLSLSLSHAITHTHAHVCTVQNWIRNRRRPTAVKSAEKFVEKISQGSLPPVPTIPNIPSLPSNMTSMGLTTPSVLSSDSSVVMSSAQPSTSNLSSLGRTLATHLSLPEPKRVCTESGMLSYCLTAREGRGKGGERERERDRPTEREGKEGKMRGRKGGREKSFI